MLISLEEKSKENRRLLKEHTIRVFSKSLAGFLNYLPQYAALASEPILKTTLLGILLIKYLKSDLNHLTYTGSLLREEITQKENELIAKSEAIAKKLAECLLDHYFYVSPYSEIQSLPGEIVLPADYQLLKKDDVEIHFKITAEGVQVYICLPGNHDSNHRFVQAQEITQGDSYLVNSQAIFFSHEKPFTENDIKEILDLVQYGSAILYFRGKKKK